MVNNQQIARIERVGMALSLVLLGLGVAELTDAIDQFPVTGYIVVLWLLAVAMWLLRRTAS